MLNKKTQGSALGRKIKCIMFSFYQIIVLWCLIIFYSCDAGRLCDNGTVPVAGLCIIDNGNKISRDEIEETVWILEEELQYAGYDINNLVETFDENEVVAEFVDFNLAMNCEHYAEDLFNCEEFLGGVNYDGNYIYVRYQPCLGYTAFAHELLHSVEVYYLNYMGYDHMTPWFFYEYAENNPDIHFNEIIERRTTIKLICSINSCEDDRSYICDNLDEYLRPIE